MAILTVEISDELNQKLMSATEKSKPRKRSFSKELNLIVSIAITKMLDEWDSFEEKKQ